MLYAWVGLEAVSGSVERIQRDVYRRVLSVLRPAESAMRRLIVLAARDVDAPASAHDFGAPVRPIAGARKVDRAKAFPLFDRRIDFERGWNAPSPRIRCFDEPVLPPCPEPKDDVAAERLCARLRSLSRALETLPAQARRLARWRMRNAESVKRSMRPGRPPGFRQRPRHMIDSTLVELHQLALIAMAEPDTS